jgi:hypothetical protein
MNDLKFTTAGEYMNESLFKLKQQAGIQDNPDQEGLDLFAQLIVKECASIADCAEPYQSSDNILKYFGIDQ